MVVSVEVNREEFSRGIYSFSSPMPCPKIPLLPRGTFHPPPVFEKAPFFLVLSGKGGRERVADAPTRAVAALAAYFHFGSTLGPLSL